MWGQVVHVGPASKEQALGGTAGPRVGWVWARRPHVIPRPHPAAPGTSVWSRAAPRRTARRQSSVNRKAGSPTPARGRGRPASPLPHSFSLPPSPSFQDEELTQTRRAGASWLAALEEGPQWGRGGIWEGEGVSRHPLLPKMEDTEPRESTQAEQACVLIQRKGSRAR